jgi:hypothetical protein
MDNSPTIGETRRQAIMNSIRALLCEEYYQARKSKAYKSSLRNQKKTIDHLLMETKFMPVTPEEFADLLPDCNREFAINAVSKKSKK